MSSADGWLVFGDEPQAGARVMPRKTAALGGRGPGLYPESSYRASWGPRASVDGFSAGSRFPELRRRGEAKRNEDSPDA